MHTVQYTIRGVPQVVDKLIRKQARENGQSFNSTVVQLLTVQTTGSAQVPKTDDFDWLFGKSTLDTSFDEALAVQSQPEESLWR